MRVKSWEEFYADEKDARHMLRWGATHAELVSRLIQHGTVLEVGTGTGQLSGLVSRFCRNVTSIDTSEPVLRNARGSASRVGSATDFVRADAFTMPFASQSFDAAFSQGLLEHFSDEEVIRLVREQLRVAAQVYVSVPSFFYPHVWRLGPGLVGNERLKTLRFWRLLLREFNLDLATYYTDFKLLTFSGVTFPWPSQVLLGLAA